MKARDIALLCTAAGTAGLAAAAAVKAGGKQKKTDNASANAKKTNFRRAKPVLSLDNTFNGRFDVTFAPVIEDKPDTVIDALYYTANKGLLAVCRCGGKPVCLNISASDFSLSEINRPEGVSCAAVTDLGTVFLNSKGVVFIYDDPEREPVLRRINSPRFVSAENGMVCVYSDSLMYVYTPEAVLIKTVSLCAMFDIKEGDICDAEETDDSFSSYEVTVTKTCDIGKAGLTAVLTEDGRAFLAAVDDEFCTFEKAYDNTIDVCVWEDNAYFLCALNDGYGLIIMKISEEGCETAGKFRLCGKDNVPKKIIAMEYGLAVLFENGRVHALLPEIENDERKKICKAAVRDINSSFSAVRVQDIFPAGKGFLALIGGKLNKADISLK